MIPYCALLLEWLHKRTEGELEASNVTVTWLWDFLGGTRTQIQHGTGSFSLWFASVPWHYWITAADWRHNGESIAGQQGRELWLLSCWVSMTFDIPNFNLSLWRIQSKRCIQKQLSQQRISNPNCSDLGQHLPGFQAQSPLVQMHCCLSDAMYDCFPDWNWFHNWLCDPESVVEDHVTLGKLPSKKKSFYITYHNRQIMFLALQTWKQPSLFGVAHSLFVADKYQGR